MNREHKGYRARLTIQTGKQKGSGSEFGKSEKICGGQVKMNFKK